MACIHLGSIRTLGRCIRNFIGFIRSQGIIFGNRINCWWIRRRAHLFSMEKKLNPVYLHERNKRKIVAAMHLEW